MTAPRLPLAFEGHDHAGCVSAALSAARARCAEEGLRLTPARARVLEILLEAHAALGAYDVLERLSAEGLGAQPPAAYRALDFLVAHGFAHRVERLNAYVACARPPERPGARHHPAFMICRGCRKVAEAEAAPADGALGAAADRLGFAIEAAVQEAEGLCPVCRASGAGA